MHACGVTRGRCGAIGRRQAAVAAGVGVGCRVAVWGGSRGMMARGGAGIPVGWRGSRGARAMQWMVRLWVLEWVCRPAVGGLGQVGLGMGLGRVGGALLGCG